MALSTISNLKEQLGIGARANLFDITFVWPTEVATRIGEAGIALANQAKFLCKSAAIPAFTLGVIEVPYRGGRRIKVPGDRTFGDWTATFIADDAQALRGGFNGWLSYIKLNNYDNESIRPGKGFDYMADLRINHLKQDGTISRSYQLFECFPTDVGAIDLSYDSTDTISEFTVTFQYHSLTAVTDESISDTTEINSAPAVTNSTKTVTNSATSTPVTT